MLHFLLGLAYCVLFTLAMAVLAFVFCIVYVLLLNWVTDGELLKEEPNASVPDAVDESAKP